MINSFIIETGIGLEGMFIHEGLFSFLPRSGFVQQIAELAAGQHLSQFVHGGSYLHLHELRQILGAS